MQENLFIVLISTEMSYLERVCSIVHILICLPTRWLAANYRKLSSHNMYVRSMGRIEYVLEGELGYILSDGRIFLYDDFMMKVFQLHNEIHPFQLYC